jgi:hypothetical protein
MPNCEVSTKQRCRLSLIVLLLCCVAPEVFAAAPPKIDYLYPAGGQQGTSVNVQLAGMPGDESLQSWSSEGQLQINVAEDKKFATIVVPQDAQPGVHWLRFYNSAGVSVPRAFIVGHISERAEEESNDIPEQAGRIPEAAATVNGVLSKSGDVDIYQMEVPAGQTLVASMQAHRDLSSPMDASLQILDAAGTVVAQNDDDHGLDPQLSYTVPTDGTWYVRTFAFPAAPNSTIKLAGAASYVYRLTITHGPFIDHVFPAVVDRRSASAVAICGWNLAKHQRTVGLKAFDQSQIHFGRDFALPYSVHGVTHASHVESDVSRALAVNSSISGRIAKDREKDAYTLPGIKGQKLTVSVKAREIDSLLDPVLIVTSADGKVLSEADDISRANPDVTAAITVPDDGPLTVTVEDRYQAGGCRYFYALTCEETQPAFTATVGANQYVVDKDEPIEVPVTIARKNGFADRLTVSLERLPGGIKATPVVSEKEGDSSKAVTLQLQRGKNAAAFSGPIQVLCRSEESGQRQFATAAIAGSTSTTSDVWLTVIPKEEAKAE